MAVRDADGRVGRRRVPICWYLGPERAGADSFGLFAFISLMPGVQYCLINKKNSGIRPNSDVAVHRNSVFLIGIRMPESNLSR